MNIEVIHMLEGISNATLTAYIQEAFLDHQLPIIRPAIIICPGGAYIGITEKEAEPVAMKFLSEGYHVFILRYSIGVGQAMFPAPFLDAARAVMLVRENARRWCVDPDKIALCGFSTGGHVASVLATSWQDSFIAEALNSPSELFKPNALILCYPLLDIVQFRKKCMARSPEMEPLIEMILTAAYGSLNPSDALVDEWTCKNRISSHMPPTFIWTTTEDAIMDVEECLDFIKGLAVHDIPYEFHIFEKGAHGLSLADQTVGYKAFDIQNNVNVHKWVELALHWLAHHEGAHNK